MPLERLDEMTYEDVERLDRSRAVAILPIGAIEAHGPHLPLGTDVVISEAMARRGGERLADEGYHVVLLPVLAYSPAPFAEAFAGTISVAADTFVSLVTDVARGLARHGLARLVVANAHVDPANLSAIDAAVAACRDEHGIDVAFPNVTRRPWALRLTDEFKSGACHAGRYEGSIVMSERSDLVRHDVQRELAPNPASLSVAVREGKRTFHEAGGPRAYFGAPAEATAEEGRATVETLGDVVYDAAITLFGERRDRT